MNNYTIYQHISPSGKSYFGLTGQSVEQRWKQGSGYKDCPAFQNAINKYGWDNFQHKILHTGLTFEEARELEKFYITLYQTYKKEYGYNITLGGEGKRIPYEDVINLYSEGMLVCEIAEKLGVCKTTITKYLKDLNISHEEVIERMTNRKYTDSYNKYNEQVMSLWNQGYCMQQIHKIIPCDINVVRNILNINGIDEHQRRATAAKNNTANIARRKPVFQYTLQNELIKSYSSVYEAMEETGIDKSNIRKCCQGAQKTAGGYLWKYS